MFNLWQSKEANLKEHKIMIIMEIAGKDKDDSAFRDTAVQEKDSVLFWEPGTCKSP